MAKNKNSMLVPWLGLNNQAADREPEAKQEIDTTSTNNDTLSEFQNTSLQQHAHIISLPAEEGVPTLSGGVGLFARLKKSLINTRLNLGYGLIRLFHKSKIDDAFFELLEEQLLVADVGFETTQKLLDGLNANATLRLNDTKTLYNQLRLNLADARRE